MDADKPVQVVNIPPVRFIGGPSKQGIKGDIQGYWYPDRSVAVLMSVGIPLEEAFS